MSTQQRRRSVRRLATALALGAVAVVGLVAAVLVLDRAGAPAPSSSRAPSPVASATAESTPQPSENPPSAVASSARSSGPLGSANDAVMVRSIGDGERPERLEVSLLTLDAGAFETNLAPRLMSTIPGSAVPDGYVVNSPDVSYGQDGWLALDLADAATFDRFILIVDLRAPDETGWLVPGRITSASWGPRSVLAVPNEAGVALYDPNGRGNGSIVNPVGTTIRDAEADPETPPIWLADGSGLLAWRGDIEREFGSVDLQGAFVASDRPPAVFQARGLERRWGADGSELSYGCPTEGGPEGCVVSSALNGGPPTVWFTEGFGGGTVMDYAWDGKGVGIWLLLAHVGGEGPVTYSIAHASSPGDLQEIAAGELEQPSDGGFDILGLRDSAPTLDDRHILVGPPGANVQAVVSGDGATASMQPTAWFAGWAADQGPYPAR